MTAATVFNINICIGAVYLHYKGGRYLPVAVAERHTHNGDLDVVYVSHDVYLRHIFEIEVPVTP
jgi:hypothetical protein